MYSYIHTVRMGEKVVMDDLYSLFSIFCFFKTIPFDGSTGPHDHDPKALTVVKGLRLYWCYASWWTLFIYAVYDEV